LPNCIVWFNILNKPEGWKSIRALMQIVQITLDKKYSRKFKCATRTWKENSILEWKECAENTSITEHRLV